MVRPGLKRLQEAQRVKVQPNKTGTSFMLGQSVYLRGVSHNNVSRGILAKNGVKFNSSGNTPYNKLENSKSWTPNPTDISNNKADTICCNNIKQKVWAKDASGNIIGATYNPPGVQ